MSRESMLCLYHFYPISNHLPHISTSVAKSNPKLEQALSDVSYLSLYWNNLAQPFISLRTAAAMILSNELMGQGNRKLKLISWCLQ